MATFSREDAHHLMRRAGFGGTPEEIDRLVSLGREAAVDYLVNYEGINNKRVDKILRRQFGTVLPALLSDIQAWWFMRMVLTRRPLEEKMTLFWSSHFATEWKVVFHLVYQQNLIMRQNALARFNTLVTAVAKSPAMLRYLDNVSNVKEQPNENYARELMELHTMGINDAVTGEPNYTQKDVEEVARAFTGWTFTPEGFSGNFRLNEGAHDFGPKSIFGRAPANLDGADVIDIICDRVATARFITKRLFDFFVYPITDSSEDKATIDRFASVYMQTDHSIKELVRAIFRSEEFFSERARFALRRSPIELLVGAIRMFGATLMIGRSSNNAPTNWARRMGQSLFEPPNVSGWDPEFWLNSGNMLERFNFATALITKRSISLNSVDATLTNE